MEGGSEGRLTPFNQEVLQASTRRIIRLLEVWVLEEATAVQGLAKIFNFSFDENRLRIPPLQSKGKRKPLVDSSPSLILLVLYFLTDVQRMHELKMSHIKYKDQNVPSPA
ncbi:hypothetical protein AMTR_s00019p00252520 [Amborella trichopoda]|uniref:Uncharacterized protein n=1 Tax=Amborella trichopoda TaxID=13333 RepID=W1PI94_AMBTC|nr:hypothetical protein AMTR_s00019p00252520 [Amborella trichopoda]